MFRYLANFIKTIIFTSLFIFASTSFSETLTSSIAAELIDIDGNVVIPDNYTAIEDSAFEGLAVYSVDIPGSVINIGERAFRDTPLTYLKLGNGLITINREAFYNTNIKTLEIPDSVTSIGFESFNLTPLENLTLGNSVESIDSSAFSSTQLTTVIIPDSVTSIGSDAFYSTPLGNLTLGNSVESIGNRAFYNTNIKTLEIPDSVTSIGSSAFYSTPLENLTLGNSVESIYSSAFSSTQLTTVIIPDSVTSIGSSAFSSTPLENLTLGNSLQTIEYRVFYRTRLTNVVIPDNVLDIKQDAFRESGIKSLMLGKGIENIQHHAFAYNPLETLFIYSYISNIDPTAFYASTGYISEIYFNEPADWYFQSISPFNSMQEKWIICNDDDQDNDLIIDCFDEDSDNDGVLNIDDAFPLDNTESLDFDNDGIGDNSDNDDDNDGVLDEADAFPLDQAEQTDSDGDGIGDNADFYPLDPDRYATSEIFTYQINEDGELVLTGCNGECPVNLEIPSSINDRTVVEISSHAFAFRRIDSISLPETIRNIGEGAFRVNNLTILSIPNTINSLGKYAFYDNPVTQVSLPDYNYLYFDYSFNNFNTSSIKFLIPNGFSLHGEGITGHTVDCSFIDTDLDGEFNCVDGDDDNDGVNDPYDYFPLDSTESADNDSDGIGNNFDPDDDNDGFNDIFDSHPFESGEQLDSDMDGIGNNRDVDDDNDGILDDHELTRGTNPLLFDTDGDGISDLVDLFPTNINEWSDSDNDGLGDNFDVDDDNDGVPDSNDAFPHNSFESQDSDNDGVGDNADYFPFNSNESLDSDFDGIGNNADPDDDNDGVLDDNDAEPFDASIGILPMQFISVIGNPVAVNGYQVSIDVEYDVSDADNQLPGIGFRVHYDSSKLTYVSARDILSKDIIVSAEGPFFDNENFDNDLLTDKYISFGWASVNGDWPNENLPTKLLNLSFNIPLMDTELEIESTSTLINFSRLSTTFGYGFDPTNFELNIVPATWDFDGNGVADALTDGLLLLRYTFGLRGEALTDSVVADNSSRTASQVAEIMEEATVIADIDGNGVVDALTDGLMLLRYLFGLNGESLIDSVVDESASRVDAISIENYIEAHMPGN